MGDFNVNLLAVETCNYAHNFLLSLQSFSLIPTIDKPTRVYNNSATLIDNILINKFDGIINSGNIISDISDHYSQFCIIHSVKEKAINRKTLRRDFSQFSEKILRRIFHKLIGKPLSLGYPVRSFQVRSFHN